MLAGFSIELTRPETWPAIPLQALVRENSGLRSVWVTNNGIEFKRRLVRIGIVQADLVQILDGLEPGETIALNKALFLSNFIQCDALKFLKIDCSMFKSILYFVLTRRSNRHYLFICFYRSWIYCIHEIECRGVS
jgi:hypothetical protein